MFYVHFFHFTPTNYDISLVEKALNKLGDLTDASLVVVGGCFSSESVDILNFKNEIFLSLSEFYWTDAASNKLQGEPKS